MRRISATCAALSLLFLGCSGEDLGPEGSDQCATLIGNMSACYPDLTAEGRCTQETLDLAAQHNLFQKSCEEVAQAGKADWFSLGGFGAGEHVCNWLFCCDDYEITWYPSADRHWNIVSVVQHFQAQAPAAERATVDAATDADLRSGVSVAFEQDVQEYSDLPAQRLAVHISRLLIEVPYAELETRLPAEAWGVNLDHYLGGQVVVFDRDTESRATRQLERMVLTPLPIDFEHVLSNNDMTKVEVIEYADERATVYWRVMHSNNASTVTDVGSVDFQAWNGGTLVTFHSAHRLQTLGGIPIPNALLKGLLSQTFMDFLTHYRDLLASKRL